jgi:hypothetical protein
MTITDNLADFLKDVGATDSSTAGANRLYNRTLAAASGAGEGGAYAALRKKWDDDVRAIRSMVGVASDPNFSAAGLGLLKTMTLADFNANVAGNREAYYRFLAPGAKYIQARYGVPGVFMLATGKYENSWGKEMKGKILFNERASDGYIKNGGLYQHYGSNGNFRDYATFFEAVDAFGILLSSDAAGGRWGESYRQVLDKYKQTLDLTTYVRHARDHNPENPTPEFMSEIAYIRSLGLGL